jgi:hypothetical protein
MENILSMPAPQTQLSTKMENILHGNQQENIENIVS